MEVKQQLRTRLKQLLKTEISAEAALDNGKALLAQFQTHFAAQTLRSVSVFIAKTPEISTDPILRWLLTQPGCRVHVPAWERKAMWMCRLESLEEYESLLKNTPNGTIPMPSKAPTPIETHYDAIIIPGLLFDRNCHRLGYGFGHYDYFLHYYHLNEHPGTRLVGVGHDLQVLPGNESLPYEAHDFQLDTLLTPTQVIRRLH
jgi:5,10-methenyltetrahydrofolate synthetase